MITINSLCAIIALYYNVYDVPMSPEEQLVEAMLDLPLIPDKKSLTEFCKQLFSFMLNNEMVAKKILQHKNQFVAHFLQCISDEQLCQFSSVHPRLTKKLILLLEIPIPLKITMLERALQALKNPKPKSSSEIEGRTIIAIQKNPYLVQKDQHRGIYFKNGFYQLIDRNVRNFNSKLCSAGGSTTREIIILDPSDSELKDAYSMLKNKISNKHSIIDILTIIKTQTRFHFPNSDPEQFIQSRITPEEPCIFLSAFMKQKNGVCRHHTLLNCYFMSRLIQDGLLHGDIIHHRQDLNSGAHAWNIFKDQDGKIYSLDSLWNNVVCITDSPGRLNKIYSFDVEKTIKDRYATHSKEPQLSKPKVEPLKHEPAKCNFFPAAPVKKPAKHEPSHTETLKLIKQRIENTDFTVGNYILFKGGKTLTLSDGSRKRVPHRIFGMYQAILNKSPTQAESILKDIHDLAQQALKSPRLGRNQKTTHFYENILSMITINVHHPATKPYSK